MKVSRAIERFAEFQRVAKTYLAAPPFVAEYRMEPSEAYEHVIVATNCTPPPGEIVLLTGEIVQALRTALDYAVATIIERATGEPPSSASTFEFPVFVDPVRYEKSKRTKLDGVSAGDIAIINAVQPFTAASPATQPLWLLHRLNIEDKHRKLHIVAGALWTSRISHTGPVGADAFSFESSWADNPLRAPLSDGIELFRYHSASNLPAALEIEFQPVIVFESPAEARHIEAHSLLHRLIEETQRVLVALSATGQSSG